MVLGKSLRGENIILSKECMNGHILITGKTGSGKSYRMAGIEYEAVKEGKTVIVFDKDGNHYDFFSELTHKINVLENGYEWNFLSEIRKIDSIAKKREAGHAVETLTLGQNFGPHQLFCLQKIIGYMVDNPDFTDTYDTELDAMGDLLLEAKEPEASSVYSRLYPLLSSNIFRRKAETIQSGKVNVIDFSGYDSKIQCVAIEIILNIIWKKLRKSKAVKNSLVISIDEIQSLSLGKNSVFFQILTESRKYGVSLLMATQFLSQFGKKELDCLNQASVKIYFKPNDGDEKKLANIIDYTAITKYYRMLRNLKTGYALIKGDIEVDDQDVDDAILSKP